MHSFAIVEVDSVDVAEVILSKCQNFALDKKHNLSSYSFEYFKRVMETADTFTPVTETFTPVVCVCVCVSICL
jgi:hypothetical protein